MRSTGRTWATTGRRTSSASRSPSPATRCWPASWSSRPRWRRPRPRRSASTRGTSWRSTSSTACCISADMTICPSRTPPRCGAARMSCSGTCGRTNHVRPDRAVAATAGLDRSRAGDQDRAVIGLSLTGLLATGLRPPGGPPLLDRPDQGPAVVFAQPAGGAVRAPRPSGARRRRGPPRLQDRAQRRGPRRAHGPACWPRWAAWASRSGGTATRRTSSW